MVPQSQSPQQQSQQQNTQYQLQSPPLPTHSSSIPSVRTSPFLQSLSSSPKSPRAMPSRSSSSSISSQANSPNVSSQSFSPLQPFRMTKQTIRRPMRYSNEDVASTTSSPILQDSKSSLSITPIEGSPKLPIGVRGVVGRRSTSSPRTFLPQTRQSVGAPPSIAMISGPAASATATIEDATRVAGPVSRKSVGAIEHSSVGTSVVDADSKMRSRLDRFLQGRAKALPS
eukprot:c15984_g1_i1.p1 GENE.c15984_g1_i1~~c15984_g1_i1.p1  ORF type:complete len:228 (+),score=55.81 c15984_g1_i1:560-1243(+)